MMEITILLIGTISYQTPWCSATYSLFYPSSSMSPVKWGLLLVSSQVNIAYISNVLLAHQYFMFMNCAHILILQTPKIVRKGKNTETNKKNLAFFKLNVFVQNIVLLFYYPTSNRPWLSYNKRIDGCITILHIKIF